jgi:hypothetical protein
MMTKDHIPSFKIICSKMLFISKSVRNLYNILPKINISTFVYSYDICMWSFVIILHPCLTCHRGLDRMLVGFTTTYAISAYYYWCCEFESWSERGVHHYVIKLSVNICLYPSFHTLKSKHTQNIVINSIITFVQNIKR